jgi:hypothetical protein
MLRTCNDHDLTFCNANTHKYVVLHNADFVSVEVSGTYSYHSAIKVQGRCITERLQRNNVFVENYWSIFPLDVFAVEIKESGEADETMECSCKTNIPQIMNLIKQNRQSRIKIV